jgi:probable rRNA maturation factor
MGDKTPSAPAVPKATADVRCQRAGDAVDPRTVRRRASRLLRELGVSGAELSVLLCDDATIHELNRQYRAVDRPTDVLAFPLLDDADPAEEPRALGDVVISVETAIRQARKRRRKVIDEVTTLLIHGLLHLLGHDHEAAVERSAMNERAAQLEQLFRRTTRSR